MLSLRSKSSDRLADRLHRRWGGGGVVERKGYLDRVLVFVVVFLFVELVEKPWVKNIVFSYILPLIGSYSLSDYEPEVDAQEAEAYRDEGQENLGIKKIVFCETNTVCEIAICCPHAFHRWVAAASMNFS